jgi:hypothetical protein
LEKKNEAVSMNMIVKEQSNVATVFFQLHNKRI